MSKIALITGINGQDGSYLAEFLLGKKLERTLKYEFLYPQPDNITFVSE
jgi:hypothetical protein